MTSAVKTASFPECLQPLLPVRWAFPSIGKIFSIASAFFAIAGSAERAPFGSPKCPKNSRPTYAVAWTCSDPTWAAQFLAQSSNTEHFSMELGGKTVVALVGVAAPNCPGVQRYERVICRNITSS